MTDFMWLKVVGEPRDLQRVAAETPMIWHDTVMVRHPDGYEVPLDVEIAPLVAEIWRAGVRTQQSCQEGHSGYAWLVFDDLGDLAFFLSIIGVYEPDKDSVWNRMTEHDSTAPSAGPEFEPGRWRYGLLPYVELSGDEWPLDAEPLVPTGFGRNGWNFVPSVEFPQSDVPALLWRLQVFNALVESDVP
ncbi:MAG: hypothetical protein M3252_01565 [Actinomycetota bacterium]|nr:hypothetical protein [Actinomycetota bacterium]